MVRREEERDATQEAEALTRASCCVVVVADVPIRIYTSSA